MSIKTDTEEIPPKELESPHTKHNSPTKRRRISIEDVESMAKLMTKRIDETGACHMLGIRPQTWFNWKSINRNNSKFRDILTHAREAKLNACIEAIDEAGDGNPAKGQRPDWRAKAFLVQQVLAPERYQQKAVEPEQKSPIFAVISSDVAASVFQKLLPEPEKMKQLPQVVDIK